MCARKPCTEPSTSATGANEHEMRAAAIAFLLGYFYITFLCTIQE